MFQACHQLDKSAKSPADPVFDKISSYLDWEEQNGFSGIISIKIKDQPIFSRTFGYANKEKQIPISNQTVFDIGSLTKQFTASGILKLEIEGKLSVEDTLGKFFPDIPEDKRSINLHQLLTHTSGLIKSVGNDYKRTNKSDFLNSLFSSELISDPGTSYQYSHAGYSLLGAVIEKVSGMTYEEYLNEKLFKPAGMEHTGYVIPLWEEGNVANGYRKCEDWGKPMDMPWSTDGPYWNLKANGGMISSSSDLMSWMKAMEGTRILSEAEKEKLFFPHVKEGKKANSYYSYGWVILKSSRDTKVIAHNGGNRRFYTDLINYKTEEVTILLLSNVDKPGNDNISWELAKIIFWPNFEPKVQGAVQECLDSLPENRIGEVAGKFLAMLNTDEPINDLSVLDGLFADYLKKKHSPGHIQEVLNNLKQNYRQIKIDHVTVTDHRIMDLNLSYMEEGSRKSLFMRLIFDEEDNYLIRMLMYNTSTR